MELKQETTSKKNAVLQTVARPCHTATNCDHWVYLSAHVMRSKRRPGVRRAPAKHETSLICFCPEIIFFGSNSIFRVFFLTLFIKPYTKTINRSSKYIFYTLKPWNLILFSLSFIQVFRKQKRGQEDQNFLIEAFSSFCLF